MANEVKETLQELRGFVAEACDLILDAMNEADQDDDAVLWMRYQDILSALDEVEEIINEQIRRFR